MENWLDQENFVLITGDSSVIQYESVRAHRKLNPWIVELGQPFDLSWSFRNRGSSNFLVIVTWVKVAPPLINKSPSIYFFLLPPRAFFSTECNRQPCRYLERTNYSTTCTASFIDWSKFNSRERGGGEITILTKLQWRNPWDFSSTADLSLWVARNRVYSTRFLLFFVYVRHTIR